jgi:hypothetical protein
MIEIAPTLKKVLKKGHLLMAFFGKMVNTFCNIDLREQDLG